MGRSVWRCYLVVTISCLGAAFSPDRIVRMSPMEESNLSDAGAEARVARQAPSPGPLFPRSRFLSMGLNILKMKGGEYTDMVEYWEQTPEIEDDIVENGVINKYTLFVPDDAGLRRFLLADAPNPFLINAELRRSMLKDLIVKGNVKAADLVDGATFTTLGGKTFTVTVKDGVTNLGDRATVTESKETLVWSFGALIFVDSPIFVDFAGMEQAIKEYYEKSKFKNPLIAPLNPSQTEVRGARQTPPSKAVFTRSRFLSMGVGILKKKGGNYRDIVEYLETTPQIEDDIVKEGVINKFTMFVPNDAGLRRFLMADAPNPFVINDNLRRNMLKDLIVKGNVKAVNLVNGAKFTTLGGKTFTVTVKDGVVSLGDKAKVVESSETLVWSFGALIFVDSPIFVDIAGMQKAVQDYYQKNPPVGPFGVPLPASISVPAPTAPKARSANFQKSAFLSAALTKLKGVSEAAAFVRYLELTPEFETELVAKSGNDYTLIVPSGWGIRRWVPADAVDPFYVSAALRKQMLADHVIIGRIKKENLVDGAQFTTLSGKTVGVQLQDGQVSIGDRATVKETEGLNDDAAPFLTTDSLIFVDRDAISNAIREHYKKNPPRGPFGRRRQSPVRAPAAPVARSVPAAKFSKSAFLSAAFEKLKNVEEAAAFRDYLDQTEEFENDLLAKGGNDYTLIVPSSWGIRRWVPADAVDPFFVNAELRKQMLADHVVIGRIKKENLVDGAQLTTLSGKTVGVKLQDGEVLIGDRATVQGTDGLSDEAVPFLTTDSLIFVDSQGISNAIREHFKKNPRPSPLVRPPVPFHAPVPTAKFSKSAFLSTAFEKLKGVEDGAAFRDYLDRTDDIEDKLLEKGGSEFTLVVPSGWGIIRWLPADAVDPFYVNPALRKAMIADHVVIGRIKKEDLVDGAELITLSGKTVKVKIQDGNVFLGDYAAVTGTNGLSDDTAPFLTTDSLILVDDDAITHAINNYRDENPSSGPFGFAPAVSVEAMAEPAELQPDALFPSSPFLARTYANIQKNDNFATFRRYLEKGVQLEEELRTAGEQAEFTMVIPDNFGIIRWLAQDAADPYSVNEPLRKKMVSDHIIRGKLRTGDLKDGATLTTLSGKQIAVKVADGSIHLGDRATVTSSAGLEDPTAPYITTDSMLFIDFDAMQEALREYHEKNPIKTPWFSAEPPAIMAVNADGSGVVHPFVQEAQNFFLTRQQQEELTMFREYLAISDKLSQKIFDLEAGTPAKYTLFASVNDGIIQYLPADVADVFALDSDYRHEMILDHIVPQKIEKAEIVDGAKFASLNGKSIDVSANDGSPKLNDMGKIVSGPYPLGDDGYLYITDSMLFFDFDKIQEVLMKHNQSASLADETEDGTTN